MCNDVLNGDARLNMMFCKVTWITVLKCMRLTLGEECDLKFRCSLLMTWTVMACGGAVAGTHLYCPELWGAAERMSSRETVSWSFSEDTVTVTPGPESRLSICVRSRMRGLGGEVSNSSGGGSSVMWRMRISEYKDEGYRKRESGCVEEMRTGGRKENYNVMHKIDWRVGKRGKTVKRRKGRDSVNMAGERRSGSRLNKGMISSRPQE